MSEESFKKEVLGAIEDVLVAVNSFSTRVDEQFESVDSRLGALEGDLSEVKKQLTQMVTKDYLDKRVSEMNGESISLVRKEDAKLFSTIELLNKKDIISEEEKNVLLKMELFPKVV